MAKSSKLWRALSVFSKKELGRLHRFLLSPYFNTRKDVTVLFELLWKALKKGNAPENEALWKAVFGDQPYEVKAFRHLQSYLLKLVEDFMVVEGKMKNRAEGRLELAKRYGEHGFKGLEASALHQAQKALASEGLRDTGHFERALAYNALQYNAVSVQQRSLREELLDWSGALDDFFVLAKLRQACSMIAQRRVFKTEMRLGFLEEVLKRVESADYEAKASIDIYFQAYRMLTAEKGAQHYSRLVEELETHSGLFPITEVRSLYLMAINFCIRSLNQGHGSYGAEVFQLYMKGLQDGWLLENNRLSPWTYKNIVSAGLKLQRFDAVADFIENYRTFLASEFQVDFYRYCIAELHFGRREFQLVLRTLRYVQIRDPLTNLRARILQIKAAYELQEFQQVEYQLDNLRQLLRRKKDLAYHKGQYVEFERLTRRVLQARPDDKAQWKKLRNEIASFKGLVEREWLLDKCGGED